MRHVPFFFKILVIMGLLLIGTPQVLGIGGTTQIDVSAYIKPQSITAGNYATLTVTVKEIGDDDAVDVRVTPEVVGHSNIVISPETAYVDKIPQGKSRTFKFRVFVPLSESSGSKTITVTVQYTDPGLLEDKTYSKRTYVSLYVTRPYTPTETRSYADLSSTTNGGFSYALIAMIFLGVGIVVIGYLHSRRSSGKDTKGSEDKGLPTTAQPETRTRSKPISGFPPELLDKYEPLEFLGEGGFAKVFKVKRKKDGKIVALKIPHIDEKTSSLFLKEIAAWYHLNHPNIVRLYKADILPIPHLEMEFVEGVSVDGKLIRDLDKYPKPVDEEKALHFIKGIAQGLAHAHSKHIFHLDLKPQNVLITSDLTPKITDWGLAKVGAVSTTATTTKGLTLLYAAPEQLDDETYGHTDQRTDIYQLGLIFYELLTGKLPYQGTTPAVVMAKVINPDIKPKPPSHYNKALAKYDGIFEKLLAKKKEDRYQSVEEFLKDLELLKKLDEERKKLKKTIEKTKTTISVTTDSEELRKLRRQVVEQLTRLALIHAQLNDKAELINALEDLKAFTKEHKSEIENAISQFELMLRESVPISKSTLEELKVLLHEVQREVEER